MQSAGAGKAFFFAKVPTHDVALLNKSVRAGFRVVDVNMAFDWTGSAPERVGVDRISVEIAADADHASVEALAAECFTMSRFHLDPAISTRQANDVKRHWARNSCKGRAPVVYVARVQDQTAGFLAVLLHSGPSRTDAVIDLIGVDKRFQGQGIGRALSARFISDWKTRADRLRVGTQVSNIPALRLYETLGFRMTDTSYVLHAHMTGGEIAA